MTRSVRWATALGVGALGASLISRLRRAARALDFSGTSVLIFGGSRGLGLVLARELAAEGAQVTVAARDSEELERARADLEIRGATLHTVVCDVRDRAQVQGAVAAVVDERGGLDVLVNVAGVIQVGPVEHMTIEDFENAMATHLWGPLYAIRAALPHLSQSATPRIVNVSSIGGKLAVPHLLPYSASKFALVGLSEGLRVELAARGIPVTTVCPGLMRTGSTYNASFKGHHRQEFAWFHTADAIPGISTDARTAARRIIEACRHGDAELIISLPAKMAVRFKALCPATTLAALSTVNRLLPSGNGAEGNKARAGWQSVSRYAPSILTRAADRATAENNEVPVANVT